MQTVIGPVESLRSEIGFERREEVAVRYGGATVTIAGQTLQLDAAHQAFDTWSRVIGSFAREGRPVSADFDEDTGKVVAISLPERLVAEAIHEDRDGLWADFEHSHARRHLSSSHPRYSEFRELLLSSINNNSLLLITDEVTNNEIRSVRETDGPADPGLTIVVGKPQDQDATELKEMTADAAKQLFAYILKMNVQLGDGWGARIPFNYPEDGCWARAHEMCRLIAAAGGAVAKLWNWGDLLVNTNNSPKCKVTWGWHVAPVVQVTHSSGAVVYEVIDPSMFDGPVSRDTWVNQQGKSEATIITKPEIYWRNRNGSKYSLDDKPPSFSNTLWTLGYYSARRDVRIEALGGKKPPYPCPK